MGGSATFSGAASSKPDVIEGIRAVGLSAFAGLHVRVCRPVRLSDV